MKKSDRWFNNKASQDTRAGIANLPVLVRTGPYNVSEPHMDRNAQGQKHFKVGQSEVGGEEVVG